MTDVLPGTVKPAIATSVLPGIIEPAPDVMIDVLHGTVKPAIATSVLPGIIEPARQSCNGGGGRRAREQAKKVSRAREPLVDDGSLSASDMEI